MAPFGWTPEGTATWRAANDALRDYLEEKGNKPPCPWCYGQGGIIKFVEEGFETVLCEGCFGTGNFVYGSLDAE
jgi:DnaJ-class molecular chaperone